MNVGRHLIIAFAALAWLAAGPAQAAGSPQSKVIIVLDASGSMWGQIDGKAKIVIAREVIRELVKDWDPNIHLGLTAYGHRRKGDCKDIQTLIPVGPLDAKSVIGAVNRLKPKGKTPLSLAVKRAAEELKYTEEKATVILITDGKETCRLDPCALGTQLEEAGVDFTTHVIGFNVSQAEQAGLRCLAKNTGGEFLAAENASGLHDALETTVTKVQQEAKKVVVPSPPKQTAGVKPGHRFSATLSEGGEILKRGMRWDIFETKQDLDGKRKHVNGTYSPQPNLILPPGRYHVVAKHGNASVAHEIEVLSSGESVRHVFVLNAGRFAPKATFAEGGPVQVKGMRWDVFETKQDLDGKRKHVNGTYTGTPNFTLTAGRYYVIAKHGNATVAREIEVSAGVRTDPVFVLNAGLARFTAVLTSGEPTLEKGMRWDVYGLEKDLDGKRKHINGTYTNVPTFTLPAGRYYIVAKNGNAWKDGEIVVTAGNLTNTRFDLNAGKVKLIASPRGRGPLAKGVRWDVYEMKKDLDGKRKHVNGTYAAQPILTLNARRYWVVVKYGQVTHEFELDVKPGDSRQVQVALR